MRVIIEGTAEEVAAFLGTKKGTHGVEPAGTNFVDFLKENENIIRHFLLEGSFNDFNTSKTKS